MGIHRLRGLSILAVVVLHGLLWPAPADPFRLGGAWGLAAAVNEVLFHDATLVFVLISGLLFMRVYAHRPVVEVWGRRLLSIGAPYAVLTLLLTPVRVGRPPELGRIAHHLAELPSAYAVNLVHGTAMFSFWFIPVALALVAVAPAVARAVRSPAGPLVVAAGLLAPLLSWRDGIELSPATFGAFLGAYVVGAAWGHHLERVSGWVDRARRWLWAVVALTSAVLLWRYRAAGPDQPWLEAVFWPQKLAAALLLAGALSRPVPGPAGPVLDLAGRYAFPVYFLHAGILDLLFREVGPGPSPSLPAVMAWGAAGTGLAIVLPAALASGLHRVSPWLSVVLVGYRRGAGGG